MPPSDAEVLRSTRLSHSLTTTQAGRLVGVTKRAWEHWESGARQIPQSSYELFMAKCRGAIPPGVGSQADRGVYVVVDANGLPVIVLGPGSWIDVSRVDMPNKVVVTSFVVDFAAGRREKRQTLVDLDFNPGLLDVWDRWRSLNIHSD